MYKKTLALIMLLAVLVWGAAPYPSDAFNEEKTNSSEQACISPSAVKLSEGMRRLWIDHVTWTRSYITSALAGLKDQDKVLKRLLQNQQDIGNAVKPYYGEAAGNKLAELLKMHILLAGKVVDAAKSGNQADLKKYNAEWYRNADEIAKFLSEANPNWSRQEIQDLMHGHLKFLTEQVTARIKKDWEADIVAYDKGEDHILKLADVLTNGIMKQFPDRFR